MNSSQSDVSGAAEVPQNAAWDLVEQQVYEPAEMGGLTTAIVYAVAEAEGIEPRHLKHPPLFDVVDTAALEAAFFGNHQNARSHDPNSATEFMYRDFRVVVRSDGWIQVYEQTDD